MSPARPRQSSEFNSNPRVALAGRHATIRRLLPISRCRDTYGTGRLQAAVLAADEQLYATQVRNDVTEHVGLARPMSKRVVAGLHIPGFGRISRSPVDGERER
jgi:hypothetical protein